MDLANLVFTTGIEVANNALDRTRQRAALRFGVGGQARRPPASVLIHPYWRGVPQIVPPEVLDAGPPEGRMTGLGSNLSNRLPVVAEHVRRMLPGLTPDDHHGSPIERNRDGLR